MSEQLREKLAEYAHEAWSGWMVYLFAKSEQRADGTVVIPKWAAERWARQAGTKYAGIPEPEKQSDREEADRMLAIVNRRALPADVREVLEDLASADVLRAELRARAHAILDRHREASDDE